jgi:hypothetical protein
MHPIDAHVRAAQTANREVPDYEIGTKEHKEWLRAYDIAYAKLLTKETTNE